MEQPAWWVAVVAGYDTTNLQRDRDYIPAKQNNTESDRWYCKFPRSETNIIPIDLLVTICLLLQRGEILLRKSSTVVENAKLYSCCVSVTSSSSIIVTSAVNIFRFCELL